MYFSVYVQIFVFRLVIKQVLLLHY